MMYLSSVYHAKSSKKEMILAVYLDDDDFNKVKETWKICSDHRTFPFGLNRYEFRYPVDKVRLIDKDNLCNCIKDFKNYSGQLFDYEPTDEFWWCAKPDAALLTHSPGCNFGFDVLYNKVRIYSVPCKWDQWFRE